MPTLPVELWWYILRLAVHIPGLFETKWDHSPDFLIWHGWESPASDYPASLQTKLSLCLVSKSWREIGLRLLYEHFFFTSDDLHFGRMSKLISILEDHTDHSSYGRSTKRMDICSSILNFSFPLLLRLLGLCHNIRIFIPFGSGWPVSVEKRSQLYSLLHNRFSHSLRRVSTCNNPPIHFPNIPLDSLETAYNLTADLSSLSMATVSTLHLHLPRNVEPPPWRFPGLRHLTLEDLGDNHLQFFQSFLSVHAPQLHSLHFTPPSPSDKRFTLLSKLLALATNLRSLVVPSDTLGCLTVDDVFPSITHIGLKSDYCAENEVIPEWLADSRYTFPGLQCVRWLDHAYPLEMRIGRDSDDEHRWNELLELARARGIRFEVNNRPLIQVDVEPIFAEEDQRLACEFLRDFDPDNYLKDAVC